MLIHAVARVVEKEESTADTGAATVAKPQEGSQYHGSQDALQTHTYEQDFFTAETIPTSISPLETYDHAWKYSEQFCWRRAGHLVFVFHARWPSQNAVFLEAYWYSRACALQLTGFDENTIGARLQPRKTCRSSICVFARNVERRANAAYYVH